MNLHHSLHSIISSRHSGIVIGIVTSVRAASLTGAVFATKG